MSSTFITLHFVNYNVVQKWRKETLDKIPYFEKLLSGAWGDKKEIELEENPEIIKEIINSVMGYDDVECVADFYGVKINDSLLNEKLHREQCFIFNEACDSITLKPSALITDIWFCPQKDNDLLICEMRGKYRIVYKKNCGDNEEIVQEINKTKCLKFRIEPGETKIVVLSQ